MIILFEIYFNVPDFTYPRRPSGPCRTWTTSNHRYGEYEGMIVTTIFYVDGSDAYTEILMSSWKHFKSWMKSPCHPYDFFFLIYNYILKLFFLFLFLLVWYVNIFWTSPKKVGGGGWGRVPTNHLKWEPCVLCTTFYVNVFWTEWYIIFCTGWQGTSYCKSWSSQGKLSILCIFSQWNDHL